MYLEYKQNNGALGCLVYRQNGNLIDVATGGDFRKGYISFTKEKFEEVFLSCAIKVLKNKPRKL